jgi:hypothetical protein
MFPHLQWTAGCGAATLDFIEYNSELAWQALEKLREQQSSALAYFDCFWLFAVAMLTLIVVVLVMKRSVVEKGARVGGE